MKNKKDKVYVLADMDPQKNTAGPFNLRTSHGYPEDNDVKLILSQYVSTSGYRKNQANSYTGASNKSSSNMHTFLLDYLNEISMSQPVGESDIASLIDDTKVSNARINEYIFQSRISLVFANRYLSSYSRSESLSLLIPISMLDRSNLHQLWHRVSDVLKELEVCFEDISDLMKQVEGKDDDEIYCELIRISDLRYNAVSKMQSLMLDERFLRNMAKKLHFLCMKLHKCMKFIDTFTTDSFEVSDEAYHLYHNYSTSNMEIFLKSIKLNLSIENTKKNRLLRSANTVIKIINTTALSSSDIFQIDRELTKLFRRIDDNYDCIIQHHLSLVLRIVGQYLDSGVDPMDLIQEGNLGLIHAAKSYGLTNKASFSGYAHTCIHQRISNYLIEDIESKGIKYSDWVHSKGIFKQYNDDLQNDPRYAVLSSCISNDLSVYELDNVLGIFKTPISIYDHELIGYSLAETVIDRSFRPLEVSVMRLILQKTILRALKSLSPVQSRVLRLRFGIGDGYFRTLEEIGNIFQVTRERVRQIESKAFERLLHDERCKIFDQYFKLLDIFYDFDKYDDLQNYHPT